VSAPVLAIVRTGLVTAVGLTAPASCAAIRAKLSNPTETRYVDSNGEWIMAHQVPLEEPWCGRRKLLKMAARVIEECLADVPHSDWERIPLLLCVAERDRPGRFEGLDDLLFIELQREVNCKFSAESLALPHGRVSMGVALTGARNLLRQSDAPYVLIVATDSLLSWPTLSSYERNERLLTAANSNGFIPGEGAAALLVERADPHSELVCEGIGLATETAPITGEEPLRGEGLAHAIRAALAEAACQMHEVDFRITDIAGEQYYFKEATLALARVLRVTKEEFDIWHPAECIGESGAVAGMATIAVAAAACAKGYALGPRILCHAGNDTGQRAAVILQGRERL